MRVLIHQMIDNMPEGKGKEAEGKGKNQSRCG